MEVSFFLYLWFWLSFWKNTISTETLFLNSIFFNFAFVSFRYCFNSSKLYFGLFSTSTFLFRPKLHFKSKFSIFFSKYLGEKLFRCQTCDIFLNLRKSWMENDRVRISSTFSILRSKDGRIRPFSWNFISSTFSVFRPPTLVGPKLYFKNPISIGL